MNRKGQATKKENNVHNFKLFRVKSTLVITNSFTVVLKIN